MANKNRREESTFKYLDKLQEKYSKLNVIRVDMSYKKPYSNEITLEDANKDLERMWNNKRSKPTIFEHQVGYVCKKEYTPNKGVHFHAYFLYDGQKVQKSAYKADQIGQYWSENITKGKGIYHNCHRNDYTYNGIGILEYKDKEKRKNLDEAISYLCKEEQNIEALKTNKQDRAFTRGTLPKSKGNIGRPRKNKKN